MVIGICDDEKDIRDILESKIKRYMPDAKIVQFSCGDNLLLWSSKLDVIFMDICMPGTDGMQTARKLRSDNSELEIVFVTGVEDYVFQAFDVGALHYLVKPIDDKKLEWVLKTASERLAERDKRTAERQSIIISVGGIHTKVYLDEVIYAEVFNRKIVIHTINDEIEYYGKMSDLENMAGEDFFRPHRAYLVNMRYVERYDSSDIYLEKGHVPMAKQNYKNFVESYMKYSMRD